MCIRERFINIYLKINKTNNCTLSFGKLIDQTVNQLYLFVLRQPIIRRQCIRHLPHFRGQLQILCFHLLAAVNCQVTSNGQAICLDGFKLRLFIPLVPYPDHRILHHILRFSTIQRNTKRQPVEFVFQGQNIVSETDLSHCSVIMTGELH